MCEDLYLYLCHSLMDILTESVVKKKEKYNKNLLRRHFLTLVLDLNSL